MIQREIWDGIEIPKELDSTILKAVERGYEEQRTCKRDRRWNKLIALAGMAAALTLVVGAGFVNPMVAKAYCKIPVVGNIFSYLFGLGEYDIPYAQIAESAQPVEHIPGIGEEGAAGEAQDSLSGVDISICEAYCDGYSLYLSVQVTSEEPFFEGQEENQRGVIQMITEERLATEAGETLEEEGGSLLLKGVFTDANTFLGVARSGMSLEGSELPERAVYTIASQHTKVYAMDEDGIPMDIRGDWSRQVSLDCHRTPLEVAEVSAAVTEGFTLQEICVQPYELQAVMAIPDDVSMGTEELWIEAFDENGNRLPFASDRISRIQEKEGGRYEIWMFERPLEAEKVTFYVLDEIKWLDEWKGHLYCDEPWTGEQMMALLEQNCYACAEVEIGAN